MRNHPYVLLALEVWVLLRCWFWNIAHNAVAHPLIPFLPSVLSEPVHEWTHKHWQEARFRRKFGAYTRIEDDF